MSNEYERRILCGIPFFVAKGAPKDSSIAIYSWSADRTPLGFYNGADGTLTLHVPEEAERQLAAWRREQAPRSRTQLRLSR